MKPKAACVVFPGSNCDLDTYYVLKDVLGIDTELLWYKEWNISAYSFIVLPGGFSYGDYLRPGSIASFSPIVESLRDFVEKERGLVMGICNGFQILTESGLLKGALTKNVSLRFICRKVELKITNNNTPFTHLFKENEVLHLPIAHSDGRYVIDKETYDTMKRNGQIIVEYNNENPNGSFMSIAGITNEKRNCLGLMPHPERGSEETLGTTAGRKFFESAFEFLRSSG